VWLHVRSGGGHVLPDDGLPLSYAIGHRVLGLRQAEITSSYWSEKCGSVITRRLTGGQASRLVAVRRREALLPSLVQAYPILEQRRFAIATRQDRMRSPLLPAPLAAAQSVPMMDDDSPRPAPQSPTVAPSAPPAPARMTPEERA